MANRSTFGGRLRVTEVEGRVASSYRFAGVGRLAFVRDADAADPLVGLASLVGKFLRDRFMLRIGDWLRDGDDGAAELASVSGYHDPKTRAFVAASALVRDRRGVPETCFVRAR
jgi:ribonuclease HII